jgi:hypothetical protein
MLALKKTGLEMIHMDNKFFTFKERWKGGGGGKEFSFEEVKSGGKWKKL